MAIVIDASVFCAYANAKDIHHHNSKKIFSDILSKKYGEAILTDYLFDEIVSVIFRKTNKKTATEIGNVILNSEVFLVQIDAVVFEKAWKIFPKENSFSFTDCTTIAFNDTFGITHVATFDKEFSKLKNITVINE